MGRLKQIVVLHVYLDLNFDKNKPREMRQHPQVGRKKKAKSLSYSIAYLLFLKLRMITNTRSPTMELSQLH